MVGLDTQNLMTLAMHLRHKAAHVLSISANSSTLHDHLYANIVDGKFKSFTGLDAEQIYLNNVILALVTYQKILADLVQCQRVGFRHPTSPVLLESIRHQCPVL